MLFILISFTKNIISAVSDIYMTCDMKEQNV